LSNIRNKNKKTLAGMPGPLIFRVRDQPSRRYRAELQTSIRADAPASPLTRDRINSISAATRYRQKNEHWM
jgi:hypothetical protein